MNIFKRLPLNIWLTHSFPKTPLRNKWDSTIIPQSFRRGYASTYEGDGKTHAQILNIEESLGLMIVSYSPHGFRLNNRLFVKGPMVIFPNTALSWKVQSIADVTVESLCLFNLLEPKLDLVIIGVGDKEHLTHEKRLFFSRVRKSLNVPVEILPTEAACTTFNFMVAESRFVGGALLPQYKGYNLATDREELITEEENIFL